ncbi:MAG: hypothetical protein ACPHL6_03985 [Rubripirellula sp.]
MWQTFLGRASELTPLVEGMFYIEGGGGSWILAQGFWSIAAFGSRHQSSLMILTDQGSDEDCTLQSLISFESSVQCSL